MARNETKRRPVLCPVPAAVTVAATVLEAEAAVGVVAAALVRAMLPEEASKAEVVGGGAAAAADGEAKVAAGRRAALGATGGA